MDIQSTNLPSAVKLPIIQKAKLWQAVYKVKELTNGFAEGTNAVKIFNFCPYSKRTVRLMN